MSTLPLKSPSGLAKMIESFRQLVVALQSLQASRYTSAAAATIYTYNIFLTFDEEVEYFWSKLKFTFPNILYIINRYVCFAFFLNTVYDLAGFRPDLTEAYCRKYTEVVGFVLAHMGWTGIMTIRVSALWHGHPRLVRLVWFFWACTMITVTVFGYQSCKQVVAGMTYNPYIRMCAPASSPKVLAATPIAPTAYELFLTSLTLLKSYDISKHSKMSETPLLLRVVARDGVAYFILSTLLSLGNMISWHLLPPSLMYLLLYLYWALLSTVIAALVLNLRRVHYQVLRGESTTLGSAVSANVTCHGSSGTDQARGAQRPRRGAAGMEKSADLWSQGSRFIMGDGELGVDSDVDTNTAYQNSREESRRTASRPDVESALPALECPELNSNGESTNAQHDASLLMQRLERTSLAPANWS